MQTGETTGSSCRTQEAWTPYHYSPNSKAREVMFQKRGMWLVTQQFKQYTSDMTQTGNDLMLSTAQSVKFNLRTLFCHGHAI